MPLPWYLMWTAILLGLGLAFRPDLSAAGFTFWALTIVILRPLLYLLYMAYWRAPWTVKASFSPFNLFTNEWRMGKPRWQPLQSCNLQEAWHEDVALCSRCDAFTVSSKLIMGSSSSLPIRLTEWHAHFWTRREFISRFKKPCIIQDQAQRPYQPYQPYQPHQANSSVHMEPSCRLCCLLWYSMSPKRQEALESSILETSTAYNKRPGGILSEPAKLDAELQIKVWEERPLSLYTCMQLFWGDVPIGARLLVYRDDLSPTPSPAIGNGKTDSAKHFQQAREWLDLCKKSHQQCGEVESRAQDFPARILYMSGGQDWRPGKPPEVLKLIRTADVDFGHVEYLAFSHTWGTPKVGGGAATAKVSFKLLASNIEACYQSGLDYQSLSQNVRDAVDITLSLGFSYIWIDSLCIIQKEDKDKEGAETGEDWKKDWESEAAKMGSVYSRAVCTIASTGSSDSNGGCFHERSSLALKPCKIGFSFQGEAARGQGQGDGPDRPKWMYVQRDDIFDFERNVDRAPLNTRGWVMQERLLSRRILHFGADMIYWECCVRSASEMNPHGYTYKQFPEDFKDNYLPLDELAGIKTRADVERAERDGRGFAWSDEQATRRRPPPVMIDPDSPPGSQAVWQHRRQFWKNALKVNTAPWTEDEEEGSRNRHAGFRAAFEELCRQGRQQGRPKNATDSDADSDQLNPSQMWYEIVEPYSRRSLTRSTDKLIAIQGIAGRIELATGSKYAWGLWEDQLPTDLLWFAMEGPGTRLVQGKGHDNVDPYGSPVAPTWSWASVDCAVAIDLLPENSQVKMKAPEVLVKIHRIDRSSPSSLPSSHSGGHNGGGFFGVMLQLSGPLLLLNSPPRFDGTRWTLDIGDGGESSARLYPDLLQGGGAQPDICQMGDLACLSFLVLDRRKDKRSGVSFSSQDIQGLLLRPVGTSREGRTAGKEARMQTQTQTQLNPGSGQGQAVLGMYERVGYFTTSYVPRSSASRQAFEVLRKAEVQSLRLLG